MKISGKDAATLLIVLGVCGYGFYGSKTGTGPVSWLNYAQQAIFGSYDERGSYLLAIIAVGVLVVLVEFAWKKVSGSPDSGEQSIGSRILFGPRATPSIAPASQKPATTLAAQGKVLLLTTVIMVIVTWVIGFAIYWSYAAEQREDASAQYEPIDLSDGASLHQPRGSRIALRGGFPLDAALAHTTESMGSTREDYQLVPIASSDWSEGKSVAFVLQIKDRSELEVPVPTRPSAQSDQAATGVLMARIDGPVPGPVALEFKKIGVTLDEPNYLLRPVKTRDGKVITELIEGRFMFFLVACGLLSVVFSVMTGLAWFIMRARAARKGLS